MALGRPLLFGLVLAVLPMVAALVVGPLFGGLGADADRHVRLATRALIAVPVVFFCPAGLYVTDVVQRVTRDGSLGIRSSGRAVLTPIGMGFAGSLGIVCAISATLFLLAWTRDADGLRAAGSGAGLVALVGAAAVLVLALVFARHWLASSVHSIGVGQGRPFPYTWFPAVLGSAVQLVVTGLAAVGIDAFRPLGRSSELLLLGFAPWLFVGSAPLAIAHYLRLADGGRIGGLIDQRPQVFVDIPLPVALTLIAAAARAPATGTDPTGRSVRPFVSSSFR